VGTALLPLKNVHDLLQFISELPGKVLVKGFRELLVVPQRVSLWLAEPIPDARTDLRLSKIAMSSEPSYSRTVAATAIRCAT
jgi:hypothetical protein